MRVLSIRLTALTHIQLLVVVLTSSATPQGEAAPNGWSDQLTYTYRHTNSQVMKELPSRIFHEETPHHRITLSSWDTGNPCDLERMHISLRKVPQGTDVLTLCDETMLQYSQAFRSIPTDFVNAELTPHLRNLVDAYPDLFGAYIHDGEFVAIPGVNELYDLPTLLPILREDWVEQVYGQIPGRRIPLDDTGAISFIDHEFTVTELYNILSTISESDLLPDGRSALASGRWEYTWPVLFGAYGLSTIWPSRGTHVTPKGIPNVVDRCTNEVAPNVITCQYRDLVQTARLWYERGILIPDHFDSGEDADTLLNQLLSGETAAVLSVPILRDWDRLVSTARENEVLSREARFVVIPPPLDLSRGTMRWRNSVINGTFMAMNRDSSDENVISALQILDYMKLTPKGFVLENYGLEGIHYDWDSTPAYAGIPAIFYDSGDDNWPYFPRYPIFRTPAVYRVAFGDTVEKLIQRLSTDDAKAWAIKPAYWWSVPNGDMRNFHDSFGRDLNAFIETTFREMVTGDRDSEEVVLQSSPFREGLRALELDRAWALTAGSQRDS